MISEVELVENAFKIAGTYGSLVSGEPSARRLWVGLVENMIDVRLQTKPTDLQTERRFYQLGMSIQEDFRLSVYNPKHFTDGTQIVEMIPGSHIELPIR